MSIIVSKIKGKGDSQYIQRLFPKFFNKDRFPKVKKQADDGTVEMYIAKKSGRRVGFVIWHESSNDWIYIDYIAAIGHGEELIHKLHDIWQRNGYKGINLDTFIYDGELPRLASVRRLNYFYNAGYHTDVIDYPSPGHVMFHMTYKFKQRKKQGGYDDEKIDGGVIKGHSISNFPRGY